MSRTAAIARLTLICLAAGAGAAIGADAPPAGNAPEPQCRQALVETRQSAADAGISPQKQAQIASLLDQVDRACQQNDDVVAMAGIDQVRAIVSTEQKSRNGS